MLKKRHHSILYFSVILLLLIQVVLLAKVTDFTAWAVKEEEYDIESVYEFLLRAERNPSAHQIVIGKYSTVSEQELAKRLSDYFGVMIRNEEEVASDTNLILIGKPNTNLLLDKLLLHPYSKDESLLVVSENNLIIVINNMKQSEQTFDSLVLFKDDKEKFSPKMVTLDFGTMMISFGVIFIAVIIVFLSYVEHHRHKGISKAKEETEEHKIGSLKRYIAKYEAEGHPEAQIREWLTKYGYDESLIEKAMKD